jgi:O-acetyl-ADP-ribose deacetylase (regulator of RNase III)
MTLRDIPEFKVLCMDTSCIGALNAAIAQQWPSFYMNLKIRLMTLNKSLREVPSSTKFQLVAASANSYGRLDGGFDDAISKRFCLPNHPDDTLTKAAQRVLYEKWRGFAPPGTCTLVPFPQELGKNDWDCQWVAICPTMRRPGIVTWDREVVYECVWSLLCQVEEWNRGRYVDRIDSVLVTPLATGNGCVSKERWAAQFVLALKHFVDALECPERWSQLGLREIGSDAREVEMTWAM